MEPGDDKTLLGIAAAGAGKQEARTWSTVLAAARIPHRLVRRPGGWQILVRPELSEAALAELAAFAKENPARPEEPPPPPPAGGKPLIIPVLALLPVAYLLAGPGDRLGRGAVETAAILKEGQWWRLLTALFLHADALHLLGNLALGGVLAYAVCRLLGNGLGWLLILLSGILGNLINVLLREPGFRSLGFSTAVFGMVGILAGLRLGRCRAIDGRALLLAAGAALALLALLGSGGERTDLGAHLWGMICGIGLGWASAAGGLWQRRPSRHLQTAAGLLALFLTAAAWMAASFTP